MYSFPSASHMREPSPRTMNGGSPPTARKARTGESTPPGIKASARFCSLRDCSKERISQLDENEIQRQYISWKKNFTKGSIFINLLLDNDNLTVLQGKRRQRN